MYSFYYLQKKKSWKDWIFYFKFGIFDLFWEYI